MGPNSVAGQSKDKPQFPRLLICEGPEDWLFFHRLIETRNLPRFHIWDTGARINSGGNTKFSRAIRAFRTKHPKTYASLRDIIIASDNDESPTKNFENVCEQIEEVFGPGTRPTAPQKRTSKIKPAITVLMVPWTDINGHLERLCVESARDAGRIVGAHVDTFMSMVGADNWNNESRYAKAWLRTNLAARCEPDPFVALGHVFENQKHQHLIPVNHASLNDVANFLASFG
jgi:hypothetical protein